MDEKFCLLTFIITIIFSYFNLTSGQDGAVNRTKRQYPPSTQINQIYPGGMNQVYPPVGGAVMPGQGMQGRGCFPILSPPFNGFPLYPCQNVPGFTCTFGCSPGFILLGSRTVTCRPETMTWNTQVPLCVRNGQYVQRSCSALDSPMNGLKFGLCNEGSPVGSQCSFTCNTGYMLNGPPLLTCQPDGMWNPMLPPICVRQAVPPPTGGMPPAGGMTSPRPGMPMTMMTTRPPMMTMMTTRPGMMMTTMRPDGGMMCPPLPPPPNGMARGNCAMGTSMGQCFFSCNIGFILSGNPVLTCNGNMWSGTPPICRGTRFNPATGFSSLADSGVAGGDRFNGTLNNYNGQWGPAGGFAATGRGVGCASCRPCIRCVG